MRRVYQRRSRGPLLIEAEGKTLEEAVQSAMRKLHAKREELEYEVIEAARGGFLGLGSRPARIRARVRTGGGSASRSGGQRTRGSAVPRAERVNNSEPVQRAEPRGADRQAVSGPKFDDKMESRELRNEDSRNRQRGGNQSDRQERHRDTGRVGRYGSDPKRASNHRRTRDVAGSAMRGPTSREVMGNGDATKSNRHGMAGGAERRGRTEAGPIPAEEALIAVQEFTKELLARMGHHSTVKVLWEEDAYNVQVSPERGDEALIGDGGETLDALQHIVAKMSSRGLERLNPVRMNIGGFRERREDDLMKLALQHGQQVKETGQEVVTEPLRAAERRIIHRTLMDDPEVTTHALGNGLIKRVWIGRRDDRAMPGEAVGQVEEIREPVDRPDETASPAAASMIDDWESPSDKQSPLVAAEWGRKRKPAKGRRR